VHVSVPYQNMVSSLYFPSFLQIQWFSGEIQWNTTVRDEGWVAGNNGEGGWRMTCNKVIPLKWKTCKRKHVIYTNTGLTSRLLLQKAAVCIVHIRCLDLAEEEKYRCEQWVTAQFFLGASVSVIMYVETIINIIRKTWLSWFFHTRSYAHRLWVQLISYL